MIDSGEKIKAEVDRRRFKINNFIWTTLQNLQSVGRNASTRKGVTF